MKVLHQLSRQELSQTIIAEIAKANNEVKTAQADLSKAQNRMRFVLAVANEILDRCEKIDRGDKDQ